MAITPVFQALVSPEGRLSMSQPVRGLMDRHLQGLAGKPVDVTIKVHRNKRTDRANRYYWGAVIPLLAEYCGYDRQEMHELLAMRFLRIEDDPVTGSPRRRRTPDTNTKEFSEYVDQCKRLGAELGVYIPEPGEPFWEVEEAA